MELLSRVWHNSLKRECFDEDNDYVDDDNDNDDDDDDDDGDGDGDDDGDDDDDDDDDDDGNVADELQICPTSGLSAGKMTISCRACLAVS